MTQYIKAPFNFVPVSEKVFFPDWADQISHDIPFSDGESGELELTITAHSPIFVRNGHTKKDAEEKNDQYKSFSRDCQDNYFIPATSIKGAIRNVLEIMSFGKMDSISNSRFAIRDLDNRQDYMNKMKKIHSGWLTKTEDLLTISDRDVPFYISHKELDNYFRTNLVPFFSKQENLDEQTNRLASFKYRIFEGNDLNVHFEQISNENGKIRVKINDQSKSQGKVVFTGQFGVRKKEYDLKKEKDIWSGKFYEFIFRDKEIGSFPFNEEHDVWKDFKFIYKDSEDWEYWEEKLTRGESIPVFFRVDDDKIESFGLSYLYKLPYNKRIKDCLPGDQNNEGLADLADCIFGIIGDSSLKGRIQFGHAFLSGKNGNTNALEPLMGSPKASYFPMYLQQKGNNGIVENKAYNTYASYSAFLKGWKRYPVHKSVSPFTEITENQRKNVSPFIPVLPPAKFTSKIKFHNLKKVELGALIYAITFNDPDAFHSLGFCKPYGYGKVKMTIKGLEHYQNHIEKFIEVMSVFVENWIDSPQIQELMLMAKISEKQGSRLEYMELPEFAKAKKKENPPTYLDYYSGENYPLPKAKPVVVNKVPPIEKSILQKNLIEPKEGCLNAIIVDEDTKHVSIEGYDEKIQLVVPMEKKNQELQKGQQILVSIKQKTKDGSINQVQFESKSS